MVAPCPHDGRCPMEGTRSWCHFAQRFQRSDLQRRHKVRTPLVPPLCASFVYIPSPFGFTPRPNLCCQKWFSASVVTDFLHRTKLSAKGFISTITSSTGQSPSTLRRHPGLGTPGQRTHKCPAQLDRCSCTSVMTGFKKQRCHNHLLCILVMTASVSDNSAKVYALPRLYLMTLAIKLFWPTLQRGQTWQVRHPHWGKP